MWSYTNTEQDWVEGRATAAHGTSIGSQVGEVLLAIGRVLDQWEARMAGRQELGHLTMRDLRDIGLTRVEAAAETSKPFWQE